MKHNSSIHWGIKGINPMAKTLIGKDKATYTVVHLSMSWKKKEGFQSMGKCPDVEIYPSGVMQALELFLGLSEWESPWLRVKLVSLLFWAFPCHKSKFLLTLLWSKRLKMTACMFTLSPTSHSSIYYSTFTLPILLVPPWPMTSLLVLPVKKPLFSLQIHPYLEGCHSFIAIIS